MTLANLICMINGLLAGQAAKTNMDRSAISVGDALIEFQVRSMPREVGIASSIRFPAEAMGRGAATSG
jgi:hypothetical protein